MKRLILFCFLSGILSMSYSQTNVVNQTLQVSWQMRAADDSKWYAAVVPGCVHTDLIRNKVIAHPFFGTAETQCQWVGDKDWIYESMPFAISDETLNKSVLRICFRGLDTYADVYINDKLMIKADNAFRTWEVDVKKILRSSGNVIRIHFFSPLPIGEQRLKSLPYPLPYEAVRAVTRKPAYHFGWDWGPKLITSGITHPIELIAYDEARFTDIHIKQLKVTEQLAQLKTVFSIHSDKDADCKVLFEMLRNGDNWTTDVHLKKGNNIVELPFEIEYPYRWWCNGQGNANLYEFIATMSLNDIVWDSRNVRTGIRTINLVTEKDSIGESFYFKLNDKPVFVKGANYIPAKYFPGEATESDYRQLLTSCRNANINMLRVWGGGNYESEIFYRICDELGIMVWQDFMFACAMYPADSLFVTSIIEEANEQTIRLRNHPSIALWCGNNESAEGWERWGWQEGLSDKHKFQIWRAYKDVFDLTLKKAVEKNTDTDYWESSPRFGRGDSRSLSEGDSHYWGVWHDEEPFEVLQKKVPRFMSEYGMQSFPSKEVVQEMMVDEKGGYNDPGMLQHQKHNRGFALMDKYMSNWYPLVAHDSLEYYGKMTQVVQAEGIAMGIEAQRRNMPRCMGTMYWQLNDLWPSFSWSGIDYKGRPKLLNDYLSVVYDPQLISAVIERDNLNIYWISDNGIEDDSLQLQYFIYQNNFNPLQPSSSEALFTSVPVKVLLTEGSQIVHSIPKSRIGGVDNFKDKILYITLYDDAGVVAYSRVQKVIPESTNMTIPAIVTVKEINPANKKLQMLRNVVVYKSASAK